MRIRFLAAAVTTVGVGFAPWPIGLRPGPGVAPSRALGHVIELPLVVGTRPAPPPTSPPVAPSAPPAEPRPVAVTPLAALVAGWATGPRLSSTSVSVSIWMEGLGEVVTVDPDRALLPASNQKIHTALGVLAAIPETDTLATEVRSNAPQMGPTLMGDLVLVGGGDPTLTRRGPHSLDHLAAAVRARGIEVVAGSLMGDETRYDAQRGAPGWKAEHVPVFIGPLSALVVDRNQHRGDAAFAADPLPGNLACFRASLVRHGIRVTGPEVAGQASPGAAVLARLDSPPIGVLVREMLVRSDNLIAELLTKEVGFRRGGMGTTATGIAAGAALLAHAGIPVDGLSADGSGLSRANYRSARQWRRMLQGALGAPFGARFRDSLPVAGRSGTLTRRMRHPGVAGNVRAKTGWIDEGRALSGYLTTAGGRRAVFSIVVNGTAPGVLGPAIGAIDELVAAIAADRT